MIGSYSRIAYTAAERVERDLALLSLGVTSLRNPASKPKRPPRGSAPEENARAWELILARGPIVLPRS